MSRVVVGIISRQRGEKLEYLLVRARKDFGEFTGCFYPPGGHIEDGELPEQALVREIAEEVGLAIEPMRQIAKTPGDVPGQVTYWWECKYAGGEVALDDDELSEAGFFIMSEIEQLPLWPATQTFFAQHIRPTDRD